MKLLIKTFQGLEQVLKDEVQSLGIKNVEIRKRAVACDGNFETLYKANLLLRTALKVLVPVFQFKAKNENELYDAILTHDWSNYLSLNRTFAINFTINSKYLKHSKYASLKMKDAIVDQFRNKTGKRPNVDSENPDVLFNLHGNDDVFSVALDSTGKPLNQRGYRFEGHQAPLNEVMAAGLLKITGWDKNTPLFDPMCGTGTFLIEALMSAQNIPAQYLRNDFVFKRWPSFDIDLWSRLRSEADAQIRKINNLSIFGNDIDPLAIEITKKSLEKLGFSKNVVLKNQHFSSIKLLWENGMVITNPPYGIRMGDKIQVLYEELGEFLDSNFKNFNKWIFSSNSDALDKMNLNIKQKMPLLNGAIPCEFCNF